MWPFSKKPNTSIGVDIGVGGLKMVELKKEGGRAVLVTYGFTEGGWGAELAPYVSRLVGNVRSINGQGIDDSALRQIASVIKQVSKKARCEGREAVASVPITALFNAVVTVPSGNNKIVLEAAHMEASKLLPLPEEEMVLDFQKIESAGKDSKLEGDLSGDSKWGKVLVTATSKILVEEYTKIFNYAGLKLVSLDSEGFALIRALLGRDKSPGFIIDMGYERMNLFVVNQGAPLIHRSIHLGGRNFNAILKSIFGFDSEEAVEQAKIDLSVMSQNIEIPPAFIKLLDPLIQDLKYNIELFKKESNHKGIVPERIVLSGGSALLPGLARFLENQFNITAYIADPWARVVYPQYLKQALDSIGPRFAVAIGLAIMKVYEDMI